LSCATFFLAICDRREIIQFFDNTGNYIIKVVQSANQGLIIKELFIFVTKFFFPQGGAPKNEPQLESLHIRKFQDHNDHV